MNRKSLYSFQRAEKSFIFIYRFYSVFFIIVASWVRGEYKHWNRFKTVIRDPHFTTVVKSNVVPSPLHTFCSKPLRGFCGKRAAIVSSQKCFKTVGKVKADALPPLLFCELEQFLIQSRDI